MPRIRTIKPEFWTDHRLALDLSREQRLMYIGLWNLADDEGRFAAHPRLLLGALFPFDEDIGPEFIEAGLQQLAATGRLLLYEINGERYGQLTKFAKHQKINRPTKSRIPPPPAELLACDERYVNAHGAFSEPSVTDHGALTEDSALEREREVEGEHGSGSTSPPSPPPPSRARARVEEGHHPGPDAAGPRLAADGEGESRDEQEPDRLALIREMQAAVEARARKLRGERRQARFVARAKAIIGGDDYTVWRDGHGRAAPWPDRPRLLRLALARTEGEDDPDLRAALRYVVLQQLDPVEPPTAEELRGHRPPPGSEAAAVRDELPQRNGHHTSELVRVGVWIAGDDPAEREQERLDALVREWERENPAEAEALRERIAEEVASDPAWQGIARAALPGLVRSRYRLAVRDLLERQEVAT